MNQRFHFMKTAFLKLPFHFSEEKLLQDLEVCKKYNFTSHFNKNDYSVKSGKVFFVPKNVDHNFFGNTKKLIVLYFFGGSDS